MVDRGADVEAHNKCGWIVVMIAVDNGHAEILNLLIDRGSGS